MLSSVLPRGQFGDRILQAEEENVHVETSIMGAERSDRQSVGESLANQLAEMRENMAHSRLQRQASHRHTTAGGHRHHTAKGAGGHEGDMHAFLDSSVRLAQDSQRERQEQQRATALEAATSKYRAEVAKIKDLLDQQREQAHGAPEYDSSEDVLIGTQKLGAPLLAGVEDADKEGYSCHGGDSEDGEEDWDRDVPMTRPRGTLATMDMYRTDTRAAAARRGGTGMRVQGGEEARQSLNTRLAKWGSAKDRPGSKQRHTRNADLRESWMNLHNRPLEGEEEVVEAITGGDWRGMSAEKGRTARPPQHEGLPAGGQAPPQRDEDVRASVAYWSNQGNTGAGETSIGLSTNAQRLARHVYESEDEGQALKLNAALNSWRQLEAVTELAQQVPMLTELTLSKNSLGEDACELLAAAVRAAPYLVSLDLRDNQLNARSMQVLGPAVRGQDRAGSGAPGVQQLLLGSNPLGDKGVKVLTAALAGSQNMVYLDVSQAELTWASTESLAELLVPGSSLRMLDLSWNRLGARGGRALGRAMAACRGRGTGLVALHLNHAGLGDDGAAHMALGLLQNRSLEELEMASNQIGLLACKALAYSLPRSCSKRGQGLLRLGLSDNPLGCVGAALLMRAIASPRCHLPELGIEQASFLKVGVQSPKGVAISPAGAGTDGKAKPGSARASQRPVPPTGTGAAALRRAPSSKAGASSPLTKVPSKKAATSKKAAPDSTPMPANARERPVSALPQGAQQTTATAGPDTVALALKEVNLHPGVYSLDLDEAAGRLCLLQLVEATEDGSRVLAGVTLNGKKVRREEGWETWRFAMPESGEVRLEFRAAKGRSCSAAEGGLEQPMRMRSDFVHSLCEQLEEVGPLDEWRLQLVHMLCCSGLQATASQALQLLVAFGQTMGTERTRAAVELIDNVGLLEAGLMMGMLEDVLLPGELAEVSRCVDEMVAAAYVDESDGEDLEGFESDDSIEVEEVRPTGRHTDSARQGRWVDPSHHSGTRKAPTSKAASAATGRAAKAAPSPAAAAMSNKPPLRQPQPQASKPGPAKPDRQLTKTNSTRVKPSAAAKPQAAPSPAAQQLSRRNSSTGGRAAASKGTSVSPAAAAKRTTTGAAAPLKARRPSGGAPSTGSKPSVNAPQKASSPSAKPNAKGKGTSTAAATKTAAQGAAKGGPAGETRVQLFSRGDDDPRNHVLSPSEAVRLRYMESAFNDSLGATTDSYMSAETDLPLPQAATSPFNSLTREAVLGPGGGDLSRFLPPTMMTTPELYRRRDETEEHSDDDHEHQQHLFSVLGAEP